MPKLLLSLANTPDAFVNAFRSAWKVPTGTSNEELRNLRNELRLMWGGSREYDAEIQSVLEKWLSPSYTKEPWFTVEWAGQVKRIHLNAANLSLVLAHGCVRYWNKLRYCRNQVCDRPFFIAGRWNQRYCGRGCANVGQKDAKLRHWRKTYGKAIRTMRYLPAYR
jgi:hypothetical protein